MRLNPNLIQQNPVATSTPAIMATTTNFTVVTATHLAITSQPPANITVRKPFWLDRQSTRTLPARRYPRSAATLTLNLGNNPGGSTLGGVLTVKAVNGVATFTGLTMSKIGVGYTLLAAEARRAPVGHQHPST